MTTESPETRADDAGELAGWGPTALVVGLLAYVVVGVFWMDAHGTGPEGTLTFVSIAEFLAAIAFWPLDLLGLV